MRARFGIRLISIFVGICAFNGAAASLLLFSGERIFPLDYLIMPVYAVIAATASVGIWLGRYWGLLAFRGWALVIAIFSISFVGVFGQGSEEYFRAGIFLILAALLLWGADGYIRSSLMKKGS